MVSSVSQALAFVLDNHLIHGLDVFRRLQDFVKEDSLNLKVGKVTKVSRGEDRFFGLKVSHDMKSVLLHDSAEVRLVGGPDDAPNFLFLLG
jgi:hypothetical protein